MTDAAGPIGVFHTRVEWTDTDASGIYHSSTVTRFVEAAEAALIGEQGLDGYFPRRRGCATWLTSRDPCSSDRT